MKSIDLFFTETIAIIDRVGWVNLHIMDTLPYTYTIGLFKTFGHPEIVISGIHRDAAHTILNNLACSIRDKRASFQTDTTYFEIFQSYPAQFRDINPSVTESNFGLGCRFYNQAVIPIIQCVWPDLSKRFPWDDGYSSNQVLF